MKGVKIGFEKGGTVRAASSKPRLAGLNSRPTKVFELLDPDTLLKASYGYFDTKTPWITSNDDALAGVTCPPDNFVDFTVTSPPSTGSATTASKVRPGKKIHQKHTSTRSSRYSGRSDGCSSRRARRIPFIVFWPGFQRRDPLW
jgi:hypothetical protein